jgi:hypothetical protein
MWSVSSRLGSRSRFSGIRRGSIGTITRDAIAHARIYLVGKPGSPEARNTRHPHCTNPHEGTMVGREIAAVLSLPFEDKHVVV